ncbi:MAG: nucleoside hydrolase [Myxococcota bacterium]
MSPPATEPVWIDTDPAIGVPGADVDDGLALVQAFHSPEIAVRGVSAVFGNAPLEKTGPIARELVARFGPADCGVFEGAASADDLERTTPAVDALCAALEREPLSVIALGPVTNVGAAVRRRPDLVPRIRRIVMVAARRPGQSFCSVASQPDPFPDLNFDCDPPAMQALLDAEVELVFAPWEVSSHVWIEEADLDRLAGSGDSGAYIARHSRPWLAIWRDRLGAPGFNPFDTLAIAAVSHPDLLETFEAGVWIEEGPNDTAPRDERGPGNTKPHLLVDPKRPGRRARYCHTPKPAFKPLLLDRLERRASP